MSFTQDIRSSFKNKQVVKSPTHRKFSQIQDDHSAESTRDTTIFGKKELNLIYQTNSLEWLPENDSICTEESYMQPSTARLNLKYGLKKLATLVDKKRYGCKIMAFYKIISNCEQIVASTKSPRKRRNQKSAVVEFDKCDQFEEQKCDKMHFETKNFQLKSEISVNDQYDDSESDFGIALKTIKCSIRSEFGNVEEDQVYLWTEDLDSSFESEKSSILNLNLDKINNSEREVGLGPQSERSLFDHLSENSSKMSSQDFQNYGKTAQNIKSNRHDIDSMTRQLEELRQLVLKAKQ